MRAVKEYSERNRNLGFRVAEDGSRRNAAVIRSDHGRSGAGFRGTLAARPRQRFEFGSKDSRRLIPIGSRLRQLWESGIVRRVRLGAKTERRSRVEFEGEG